MMKLIDRVLKLLHIEKYREIVTYLVFGVLTTVVGWGVYYAIMLGGRAVFDIPAEEVTGTRYVILYTAAQVIQWVCAVLFAFVTNKKWVFTEADKDVSVGKQLGAFAGSRLVTFGLDYVITFAGTLALIALFPSLRAMTLLKKERNIAEILSKIVAAIVVIIANYVVSKLFVFKKKKDEEERI